MTHPLDVTAEITPAYPTGDSLALRQALPAASRRSPVADASRRVLNAAGMSWFVVAVLGQLMFVIYVIGFYGRAAAQGQFETWNKVLPHGYVAGDTLGNLVVSVHLAFAAFITVAGALQLMTGARRMLPTFHRWNGRVYLLSAFVMSLGGLIMVWTRGTVGNLSQHIAISINAVLIMICGGMVLRHALARRFALHRRWALRLFLVVSGVWFFRIGLMLWIVLNQGPAGFDPKTFSGPFLTFLAFAQYLLPLAVLELYFRAQDSTAPRARIAMAAGLATLALMTAAGTAAATMIMWLPRL
jgi:hypothetical protein